jgi:type I restriction enzyme S subunit
LARHDNDGTVFGSINQAQMRALKLTGSNTEAARSFDAIAQPLDDLIRENTAQTETLEATRDLLLPKLMSGEVRLVRPVNAN